jgi:DNA-binding response OmpR family regulator
MRILIVEDEHRIANTIKKGLEQERYAADVVYDGNDGYDMASTEDYDLLILDRMLPGMDGMKIVANLRKDNNHVPILILTAKSQIEDKIAGLNQGADDYLSKPFSFEELLARIRALLRRPKNQISSKLTCGNISLDTISYEVKKGDKTLVVSQKEYALLEYLMRNQKRVVSKDDIISHVWDYDADILPNTVEAFIGSLRKKIDNNSKKSVIQTIRGFGYKFDPGTK